MATVKASVHLLPFGQLVIKSSGGPDPTEPKVPAVPGPAVRQQLPSPSTTPDEPQTVFGIPVVTFD
jgi:hypothetical protein